MLIKLCQIRDLHAEQVKTECTISLRNKDNKLGTSDKRLRSTRVVSMQEQKPRSFLRVELKRKSGCLSCLLPFLQPCLDERIECNPSNCNNSTNTCLSWDLVACSSRHGNSHQTCLTSIANPLIKPSRYHTILFQKCCSLFLAFQEWSC